MKLNEIISRENISRVVDSFISGNDPSQIGEELDIPEEIVLKVLSTPSVVKMLLARKKAMVQLKFYGGIADRLMKLAEEGGNREAVQSASLLDKMFGLTHEAKQVRSEPSKLEDDEVVPESEPELPADREEPSLEDLVAVLKNE